MQFRRVAISLDRRLEGSTGGPPVMYMASSSELAQVLLHESENNCVVENYSRKELQSGLSLPQNSQLGVSCKLIF